MIYALEKGAKEKTILEQALVQRIPIPERIQNAPDLELGLELYYQAFQKLSTTRPLTMGGEGPIPWDKIALYCEKRDIAGEQAEDFEFVIEQVDDAYLKWRADQAKKNKPKEPAKTKMSGRKR